MLEQSKVHWLEAAEVFLDSGQGGCNLRILAVPFPQIDPAWLAIHAPPFTFSEDCPAPARIPGLREEGKTEIGTQGRHFSHSKVWHWGRPHPSVACAGGLSSRGNVRRGIPPLLNTNHLAICYSPPLPWSSPAQVTAKV
ncbi:hypothetical protein VTN49DRAFT_312 [Thermomyces lanuginosus]|uniref:uncharacterized protein n=1 Tax=Thermomyces lanuginosus TaxID=5541 RepID=UPI0037427E38